MSTTVRWGILGTGAIAREFLGGAAGSSTGVVTALGSRRPGRAELAEQFAGLRVHENYESLLTNPDVDAIYVATPHPAHAQWTIAAARHGKHVLCEKPAGMNALEVRAMFAAATDSGTFLAEAYMYRLHPLTRVIVDFVRRGEIGEVRMIKSSFGFAFPELDKGHRLLDPALGGGAVLDLAGYPLSMARLIAGCASGEELAEPIMIDAVLREGPTGVDEIASALVTFPNGVVAQLSCSIALWQDNVLSILGTEGRLEVDSFWFCTGKYGGTAVLRHFGTDGKCSECSFYEPANLYSFQFEAANEAILARRARLSWPGMGEEDSVGNALAIDRWLATANVIKYSAN